MVIMHALMHGLWLIQMSNRRISRAGQRACWKASFLHALRAAYLLVPVSRTQALIPDGCQGAVRPLWQGSGSSKNGSGSGSSGGAAFLMEPKPFWKTFGKTASPVGLML
jgi:hypothetical protein